MPWRQAVVDVVLLKQHLTAAGALLQGPVLCTHNACRLTKALGGCIGIRPVQIQLLPLYVNSLFCLSLRVVFVDIFSIFSDKAIEVLRLLDLGCGIICRLNFDRETYA